MTGGGSVVVSLLTSCGNKLHVLSHPPTPPQPHPHPSWHAWCPQAHERSWKVLNLLSWIHFYCMSDNLIYIILLLKQGFISHHTCRRTLYAHFNWSALGSYIRGFMHTKLEGNYELVMVSLILCGKCKANRRRKAAFCLEKVWYELLHWYCKTMN